ncbi:ATP-binding protein [Streptomyces sp. NRRL S-813]|uniref:ATP-binding protein n=1 Tax=Streptomyces sp. NRRL S-813 TaxID=1463919 RepID=UPI0004C16A46|nr:ATP-binding protein [Streptomyces sp. NRRL S-813]
MTPARPSAAGAVVCTALLPSVPEAVNLARHFIAGVLDAWHMDELTDDSQVIVSELMTDAVVHTTSTTTRIAVERQPDCRIRIEVLDNSGTGPRPDRSEGISEYGRGLLVVDALSSRWGVTRLHGGKSTWAELRPARHCCEPFRVR